MCILWFVCHIRPYISINGTLVKYCIDLWKTIEIRYGRTSAPTSVKPCQRFDSEKHFQLKVSGSSFQKLIAHIYTLFKATSNTIYYTIYVLSSPLLLPLTIFLVCFHDIWLFSPSYFTRKFISQGFPSPRSSPIRSMVDTVNEPHSRA